MASDTSWCILSEHTFNGYVDGINKQYIMFLTDKTGNDSKIGITYGLTFKTAHTINDSHVSKSSIEKILKDRGTDISILEREIKDIINTGDMKRASVYKLTKSGFTKEDILSYKKCFTKDDLREGFIFSKKEIEEYKLEDKLVIYKRDMNYDIDFIITNNERIYDQIVIDDFVYIKPIERINEILNLDIVSNEAKEFMVDLESNKNDIKKFINSNNSYNKQSFNIFLFILKYLGKNIKKYTLSDINSLIKKDYFSLSYFKTLFEYLNSIGFKFEDPKICFDLVNKFKIHYYHFDNSKDVKRINELVPILNLVPCIKDELKKFIIEVKDRKGWGDILVGISDVIYNSLTKYYPDISEEIISRSNIGKSFKIIKDVFPDPRIENSGVNRRETSEYMRSKGRSNQIITPDQFYDDFYEVLKDASWPNGHGLECIPTFAMILTLCKRNEYEKIGKLNINWSDEFTGKIIRVALNIKNDKIAFGNNYPFYGYNYRTYVPDIYQLTDNEKENFFNYLLQNIKSKIYHNISNTILDVEMNKHMTFSLVYYIYRWGFNNYLRAAENSKSVYKESWDKNIVTHKKLRFEYLEYIFKYLAFINDINGAKDLIDSIMNWKLTKTELKEAESFFLRHFDNDQSKIISDYIFGKYFPIENKKTHLRDNRSYW